VFAASPGTTSENYIRTLPMLSSGRYRLLDNATLRQQFTSLERHTLSGHEVVKHPQLASAHDDLATAAAGVLVMVLRRSARKPPPIVMPSVYSKNLGWWPNEKPPPADASPRARATSPCQPPPPVGGFRPSAAEVWYPYSFSGRRGRWPGS
jgi:hypothetical protein